MRRSPVRAPSKLKVGDVIAHGRDRYTVASVETVTRYVILHVEERGSALVYREAVDRVEVLS